jgi:glycosyltransferase involved in cell wall biosynthesis
MPTYNGEKYIREQMDSILIQIGEGDEIIVSDDSSSDSTVEIIKSYNDSRVTILDGNNFHSPIFNLENALNHSQGDCIFLADQDDVWMPNKFAICLDLLNIYDCVVSDAKVVDSNKNITNESFFKLNNSRRGFFHNLIKNGYLGCCMCFNRKILQKALPFPKNIPMHDSWIGLVSEVYGKSLFYKTPLIYYRRHDNTASSTAGKSEYILYQKIIHRVHLFQSILRTYP